MFITAVCFIFLIKLRWSTTDKAFRIVSSQKKRRRKLLFSRGFSLSKTMNHSMIIMGRALIWIKDEAGTNIMAVSKITPYMFPK